MRVLTPGHKYEAHHFEDKNSFTVIQFIEKRPNGDSSTDFITINDGVTNEELIKILGNRIAFLDSKVPSDYNKRALQGLKDAMTALNERTKERQERGVEGTSNK
jgi:hypothetical protein